MIFSHLAPEKHKISKIGCVAREGQAWANLVFCCCYCCLRCVMLLLLMIFYCVVVLQGRVLLEPVLKSSLSPSVPMSSSPFWSSLSRKPYLNPEHPWSAKNVRHGAAPVWNAYNILFSRNYVLQQVDLLCNIHQICSAIGVHIQKDILVWSTPLFTFISRSRT